MSRARSPIRLEARVLPLLPKPSYRWKCVVPVRGAMFRSRHDPRQTAIVHRSTKGYAYQVTYFTSDEPTGDTQHRSCDSAVRELYPWDWKLVRSES